MNKNLLLSITAIAIFNFVTGNIVAADRKPNREELRKIMAEAAQRRLNAAKEATQAELPQQETPGITEDFTDAPTAAPHSHVVTPSKKRVIAPTPAEAKELAAASISEDEEQVIVDGDEDCAEEMIDADSTSEIIDLLKAIVAVRSDNEDRQSPAEQQLATVLATFESLPLIAQLELIEQLTQIYHAATATEDAYESDEYQVALAVESSLIDPFIASCTEAQEIRAANQAIAAVDATTEEDAEAPATTGRRRQPRRSATRRADQAKPKEAKPKRARKETKK